MKIYLIRHGRTTANEQKRYSGKQDVLLSESGEKELRNIKNELSHLDGLPVFTSTLTRTMQTKEILFPSSVVKGKLPFMNETNFGEFEGKTYNDLKNDPNYRNWLTEIETAKPKGGESYQEFKRRVVPYFYEHLLHQFEDTIYVTHGGVIRTIMCELVDSTIPFFEWEIPNGKGYMLEIEQAKIQSYTKL